MTDTVMTIGKDQIDLAKPCDVVVALRKLQIRLAGGDQRETVRIDGEEITFQRGSDIRLQKLIDQYERACGRASGRRKRYAAGIKF